MKKSYQEKLEILAMRLNRAKTFKEFFETKREIKNENIKRDISFFLYVNLNRLRSERERRKNIL